MPAAEAKVVRWETAMWIKTRKGLKRLGIVLIIIGSLHLILSVLVLRDGFSFHKLGGLILGPFFITYGTLAILGKGFNVDG